MNRRPLVAGALAVVAVGTTGLLSACSADQAAQTAQIRPGVAGVNLQAPDGRRVYVRNVTVEYPGITGYPKGGTAPLQMWIFNNTEQTVTLTAVNGAEVHQANGANDASPCSVPRSSTPSPVVTPSASASASPSVAASKSAKPSTSAKSASPSASASESPSTSPSPSPTLGSATINVPVPAGSCVELTPRAANYLALVGLPEALDTTSLVSVWFSFRSDDGSTFEIGSEQNEVQIPIATPDSPGKRES